MAANKKSRKYWLAEVQTDGLLLRKVPMEFCDYEICLTAVQQNRYALEYVPDSLKTKEICEAAIASNQDARHFVPEMYADVMEDSEDTSLAPGM